MALAILTITVVVIATGLILIRKYNERSWGKCRDMKSMTGKTIIITGANSGLGKATAEELAKLDARVILACRDISKGELAVKDIRKRTQNGYLKVSGLDLESFGSIREFVHGFLDTESRLDVLINNAGIFGYTSSNTKEGFEPHFGINHLGHFLLTNLLLEKIKQSSPSRIIVVSSYMYKKGIIDIDNINTASSEYLKAYCNSKLANILFCQELSKRLIGSKVDVYAVSPGIVHTNLGRHMKGKWWKMIIFAPFAFTFVRTAYQGCQTILHCAISKDVEGESGSFYRNCSKQELSDVAKDSTVAKLLWEYSERCIEDAPLHLKN